jgi:hypothetical protein
MQTYHVGLIALGIFTLLGLFAFWSWVSTIRKQEALIQEPILLEGEASGESAFYVATTFAGRPLDRVVAHGLAHRGKAQVQVSGAGVAIYRTGEKCFLIPSERVLSLNQTSAVIDKAVEKDGLVSIHWNLGSTAVETHLRFVGAQARSNVLSKLKEMVS